MMMPRFAVSMFAVSMLFVASGVPSSQTYPEHPIRIVTSSPGSGNDFAARLIAHGLTAKLGQRVIIDNRGSGVIPGETVSKAKPDAYTLLFYSNSLWIRQLLERTPYDAATDFLPVTLTNRSPNVLVVHPSLPVKHVRELIALARAKPGELNYASGATGASNHLAAELFKAMAGVNIVRVPYKSASTGLADLIGGYVELTFATAGAVAPYFASGKLRALAVSSAQPSTLYPELPTVASSGLPGYESEQILGVFAPAKTPATLIKRLNEEIVWVLNQADVKAKFFSSGVETVGSSPEQFAATMKVEMAKWGKVIKDAGIRAE